MPDDTDIRSYRARDDYELVDALLNTTWRAYTAVVEDNRPDALEALAESVELVTRLHKRCVLDPYELDGETADETADTDGGSLTEQPHDPSEYMDMSAPFPVPDESDDAYACPNCDNGLRVDDDDMFYKCPCGKRGLSGELDGHPGPDTLRPVENAARDEKERSQTKELRDEDVTPQPESNPKKAPNKPEPARVSSEKDFEKPHCYRENGKQRFLKENSRLHQLLWVIAYTQAEKAVRDEMLSGIEDVSALPAVGFEDMDEGLIELFPSRDGISHYKHTLKKMGVLENGEHTREQKLTSDGWEYLREYGRPTDPDGWAIPDEYTLSD